MTDPLQHQDAILAKIQDAATAANAPLILVLERVRKRIVALSLDPAKLQGAAMDALIATVLAEMAQAAARAVKAVPGGKEHKAAVTEALAYREGRLKRFAKSLMTTDRPSLAKALLVLKQGQGLVTALEGAVSDLLIGEATRTARAKQKPDQVLMWVPERDACAQCQRYAGLRILRPGDDFPAGLSFDPQAKDSGAGKIKGPPLHPHCRCELQTVRKGASEDASLALRREAERSIVKGWALPSESQAARRRAAQAVLAKTTLPKSVQAESRRRLREGGTFTRGVPDGSGTP